MTQIIVDGEPLWRVRVSRTQSAEFYIRGSEDLVKEDADFLAEELEDDEWQEDDVDIDLSPATQILFDAWYWTGGPGGATIFLPRDAA